MNIERDESMAYNKDFACDDCNHVEEVWKARIVDDFVYEKCVKCGSKNVRMVLLSYSKQLYPLPA